MFEDVGFRYPDAERWAVRHLNFELRAGEVLALVGENGAGKTNLLEALSLLGPGRGLRRGRGILRDGDAHRGGGQRGQQHARNDYGHFHVMQNSGEPAASTGG